MPTTLPGLSITKARELLQQTDKIIQSFPEVQFVLGHAGARDVADAVPLAKRYPNVKLHELIEEVGSHRLLFGTDWPFYHLAATLAKVLLVTEGRPEARRAILRDNADRLLGLS